MRIHLQHSIRSTISTAKKIWFAKMNIIRDMVKIVKQIQGKENIFKYQSTEINQLYLMYVVTYKIYAGVHFHWQTRYYWITTNFLGTIYAYIASTLSLMYGDISDLLFLLYVSFLSSLATCVCLLIPFGMHWYSSTIEKMFDRMDAIMVKRALKRSQQNHNSRNKKNIATEKTLLFSISILFFFFICFFDVLIFFEQRKVENYMYYLFPLPHLDKYGSKVFYITINLLVILTTTPLALASIAIVKFFDMWATICHDEALYICEDIATASQFLEEEYNNKEIVIPTTEKVAIDRIFTRRLIASLEALNEIKSIIDSQMQYFEILSSIIVVTMFICQLVHTYVVLMTDLDPAIKCKEVSIYVSAAIITFLVCHVGETLNNMSDHTSFAIYNTSWYLVTPQYRKDILQILCQTQRTICVKLSSIYPLNMNYYIRWINLIYSTTNILATTVNK